MKCMKRLSPQSKSLDLEHVKPGVLGYDESPALQVL